MKTTHYLIKNLAAFSKHTEALKKLETYLASIEGIFPVIEEVFGQIWSDNQINIELNDSNGGALYDYVKGSHVVSMGIHNRNVQKEYPENLWGCLFHETHHAFFNPITRGKRDGKIFNGGHKAEVFNYAFMTITYLKLKEKNKIDAQTCERFLNKLKCELDKLNRKFRASGKYKYESELPDNTMGIFQEYIDLFSMNTENFAKFIFYLKSSDSVFTDVRNFRQDLDEAKRYVLKTS